MSTADYTVRCETCLVVIRLGVVAADRTPDDVRLIQALNELLVDYGWLPTRSGRYCRTHAAAIRVRPRTRRANKTPRT